MPVMTGRTTHLPAGSGRRAVMSMLAAVLAPGLAPVLAASVAVGLASEARAQEGSETRDGSVVIKKLPFSAEGDTSDNDDNTDAVCPFEDSEAPDVYYRISPLTRTLVTISLCGSDYDTKVYVLNDQDVVIACNDDACLDENEDPTLRSELTCVELQGGVDYDIAVDGFGTESGPYQIEVTTCEPPPPFACPEEAVPEGETCDVGGEDDFNGGCNAEPPVFTEIECGDVICGETWHDPDFNLRDTDWYQIVTTEPTRLTLTGAFNFNTGRLGFIQMEIGEEGSGNCDDAVGQFPFVRGDDGEIVTVTSDDLPPGIHWIFIAPEFNGLPVTCDLDNDYWFELTCGDDDPCPADIDGNSFVDFNDLLQVLDGWGPCPK